jgi:hypothetical protein
VFQASGQSPSIHCVITVCSGYRLVKTGGIFFRKNGFSLKKIVLVTKGPLFLARPHTGEKKPISSAASLFLSALIHLALAG